MSPQREAAERYAQPKNPIMEKINFDEKEIIEALERSGYLFESEISKLLIEQKYFVETNKVIKDSYTGKSREIDLVAEFFDHDPKSRKNKCFNRVKFVVEMKNISAPLVLLTEFQNSEYAQDWEAIKEIMTMQRDEEFFSNIYWHRFTLENKFSIFTQYCSFQRKNRNDQLMALHPDNIYSGLSKICQYCEEELSRINNLPNYDDDEYLRNYLFLPVLLISDDLYELKHSEDNSPSLSKSECSLLLYNYHYEDRPKMAYIFVVTKAGLQNLLDFVKTVKLEVLEDMIMQKRTAAHNKELCLKTNKN
ncbi:MAG: hypothetical protein M0D53_08900 [Flavobacterium sp. JAD_PAG50586_2]|nr:MAG: hypothetical protein M0D53_08900 [Flavobacterium sp. JAD_PAG50586_2]